MNLVADLKAEILDSNSELPAILRRAKVLAYSLKSEELKQWVELELGGYPVSAEGLPAYRKAPAQNVGNFSGPVGARMNGVPIPIGSLPDHAKDWAREVLIVEGVGSLQTHARSDEDLLQANWPADLIAEVQDDVYQGYSLVMAWKPLTRARIMQVLESIRNSLLNFILELEDQFPEETSSDQTISSIPPDGVSNIFHYYIVGDHNVVASGGGFTQTVVQSFEKGDLASLLSYLTQLGVEEDDFDELKAALEEEKTPRRDGSFGPKVAEWLGKMVSKAAQGTWKTTVATAGSVLAQAVAKYYGLGV